MNFRELSGARPSRYLDEVPILSARGATAFAATASEVEAVAAMTLAIVGDPVNQNDIPCCVAITLTTAMQFVGGTVPLSPLFNYFLSRPDPAALDEVEIANAFRSASIDGICARSLHPSVFDEPSALATPSTGAVADALMHRLRPTPLGLSSFGRVDLDVAEWKAMIAKSLPVVFAFSMSPEYDAIRNGSRVELAAPSSTGEGHAALVIGFDDAAGHFIVRDSRGPAIGIAGTWHLPYSRIGEAFIFESWVVTAVP